VYILSSFARQNKIVAWWDALAEKIEELKKYQLQTAQDLNTLSQSILHEAFEGNI
jgi:hypothetical protein